jgi:peptidoglycan-associated lipoprotein
MKFKSLSILVAALFAVAACESTSTEQGGGQGGGSSNASSGASSSSSGGSSIAPGSGRDFVINVGDRVFFALDKSNLSGDARATLEKQAAWLKRYGNVTITLEGHADERGTREYNLALGERRANSAKDFLVALGVSPNRIKVISYGKERPAALGHNETSWRQNRRAVTVTTGGAGS